MTRSKDKIKAAMEKSCTYCSKNIERRTNKQKYDGFNSDHYCIPVKINLIGLHVLLERGSVGLVICCKYD